MRRAGMWLAFFSVALLIIGGPLCAGEAAKKPEEEAGDKDEVVAKVNDVKITRAELIATRRQIIVAARGRGAPPNNEAILDQLIDRAVWQRHFDKEGLNPTGAEVQGEIQALDNRLRRQNSTYPRFLAAMGLSAEAHAAIIRYQVARRRLIKQIVDDLGEERIRAEFDAHPEWYDGSRIRLSQIFIDTTNLGDDPKQLEKAKKKIDKCYAELKDGKDFARVARDRSEGPASSIGGDRSWHLRKGPKADEELISGAWDLKKDEFTKPIRGSRGWHIIKVTDRHTAYFTYQGSKERIRNALVRRKLEATIKKLRAKAKIQKML